MTRSPNPIPLRPVDRTRSAGVRPAVHIERAAFATMARVAHGNRFGSGANAAKQLFPDDEVTPLLVQRAPVAAATTGDAAWAGVLAQQALGDFIASLAPQSAAARLISAAPTVTLNGIQKIAFPRRQGIPATDVAWVGEGEPIPARRLTLTKSELGPARKMACIVVLSREVVQRTAGEAVVRTALREDTAASLDAALFSNLAATDARPAGLLHGLTPIGPAAGGGHDAMLDDLEQLAAAVAGAGGSGEVVFIMAARQAVSARLRLGADLAMPVWSSAALAGGTVVAVDPLAFASGFGPDPDIEASLESTVHLEDTSPLAIGTAGSPNVVAAPVMSAFQTDSIVLRLILGAAWIMRGPGLVQVVNGATWG